MLRSHVVEVNGAFVGAVVPLHAGFRFVAADVRVEELDGSFWPSLDIARSVARQFYLTGRLPRRAGTEAAQAA